MSDLTTLRCAADFRKGRQSGCPMFLQHINSMFNPLLQVNFERIFQLLYRARDHGGLLLLDESSQFFEMLDAYKKGNSDRARALQWRGNGPWTRELVNDTENKTCPFTNVVICGFTQPEPLEREIMKTPNDGLPNRWLCGFPPPSFPTLCKCTA